MGYAAMWKNHHKRVCGLPPFRPPGVEELLLCQSLIQIDKTLENTLLTLFPNIHYHHDNPPSEDDWESLSSTSTSSTIVTVTENVTDTITRFFEEKSFNAAKREELPFANFY